MTVSSRTPEGIPNRCPVCGSAVAVQPSLPFGDAPCPVCGTLLWFVRLPAQTIYFRQQDSRTLQFRAAEIVARQLGIPLHEALANPAFVEELQLDSLEVVELALELEDEFTG